MPLSVFDDALAEMDQDAWYALLFVSMRRQRPDVAEAELDQALFVEVMSPIVDAITATAAGKGDAVPPLEAGEASATPPDPVQTTTREDGGAL
jgi:hypothetical protein